MHLSMQIKDKLFQPGCGDGGGCPLTFIPSTWSVGKRQTDLWVQDQPGLQSEFQDSQGYTEKPWKIKIQPTNQTHNQKTNTKTTTKNPDKHIKTNKFSRRREMDQWKSLFFLQRTQVWFPAPAHNHGNSSSRWGGWGLCSLLSSTGSRHTCTVHL